MSLAERLEKLDPRERRLLVIMSLVFMVVIVLLIPVGVSSLVGSKRDHNLALREAIDTIHQSRGIIGKAQSRRDRVIARYAQKAPPLAAFLETVAKENELEIPESQDLPEKPHGKKYEERSTKIVLRRVGMYNLARFMESIAKSRYPMVISRLNIRKNTARSDAYDVEMIISAYDRKGEQNETGEKGKSKKGKKGASKSGSLSKARDEEAL